MRVLPLSIAETDTGKIVVVAACGAEAADVGRRIGSRRELSAVASPAAVTRMVLHAKRCQACKNATAGQR